MISPRMRNSSASDGVLLGAITPKFIRIPVAVALTGISRSKLYEILGAGKVASVSLREEGQTKATRLVSFDSLMRFLEARTTGGADEAVTRSDA